MSYRMRSLKHKLPEWFSGLRSLYCPVSGGAGASLMSFALEFDASAKSKEEMSKIIGSSVQKHFEKPAGFDLKGLRITEKIRSFEELPLFLEQARQVNSSLVYLADYWEGGYFSKGDYIPRADMGGPGFFRDGIRKIHDLGGKVIVYLEAFIVSRKTSKIGREKGSNWAMMDSDGQHLGYSNGLDQTYYQMWPGRGSGWSKYLADMAEKMLTEYDVDGFHLDSYGMQYGWKDHHPDHIDGKEPGAFNMGAIDLMLEFRKRVRSVKPEAIVIMEGCEIEELLAASDGAQDWSFVTLKQKPWFREHDYKVFTSELGLPYMQDILASGYDISIGSWWLQNLPTRQMADSLKETEILPVGNSWLEHILTLTPVRDLWWYYNYIWANGLVQPGSLDMEWLRKMVPPFPFPSDPYLITSEGRTRWKNTVKEVLNRFEYLDPGSCITPAEYLKKMIKRAGGDLLVV